MSVSLKSIATLPLSYTVQIFIKVIIIFNPFKYILVDYLIVMSLKCRYDIFNIHNNWVKKFVLIILHNYIIKLQTDNYVLVSS